MKQIYYTCKDNQFSIIDMKLLSKEFEIKPAVDLITIKVNNKYYNYTPIKYFNKWYFTTI